MSLAPREALRLARPPRPRWSLGDVYIAAVGLLLAAAMLGSAVSRLTLPLAPGGASAVACLVASALASLVAAAAGWLTGPLHASAADATWLLSTRVDRAGLLRPRWWRVLGAGVAAGGALAVLAWAAVAPPAGWLVAVAAAPAIGLALAALTQERVLTPGVAVGLGALACAATALAALGPAIAWAAGPAVAVVLAGAAARHLGRLDRYGLARHGRSAAALGGAALGLDAGLALDVVTGRATVGGGRVRPRGEGGVALATADLARLRHRAWPQLAAVAAADAVVAVLAPSGGLAAAAAALLLVPALAPLLGMLRRVHQAAGLRRALPPQHRVPLASAGLAVAAANTLVVALLLVGAGGGWAASLLLALAANLGGVAGAIRWVTAPAPDFGSRYVVTDAGAAPVGALLSVLRGPDLALVVACVLAASPPSAAAGVAALALARELRRPERG